MILNFRFGRTYFITLKMVANFQMQKRKIQKFLLIARKSFIFCLTYIKWGQGLFVFMSLFIKHGYSEPKCQHLHNVKLTCVSFQRTAQTRFRVLLLSRIMGMVSNSTVMTMVHCKNGVLAIDTSFVISFETCLFIDMKSCLYARQVQR